MTVLSGVVMFGGMLATQALGSFGAVVFGGMLPLVVISLATALRRLHDRGKNAAWLVLFAIGPLTCLAIANTFAGLGVLWAVLANLISTLAGIALWVWGWIELGFRRGDPQSNLYGADPMAEPA